MATLLVAASACRSTHGGTPVEEPLIRYEVSTSEPETGLIHVRVEIAPEALAGFSELPLTLRDLARNPSALRSFEAWRGGPSRVFVQPEGSQHAWTIPLDSLSESPLVLEYEVDPTYLPPGPGSNNEADARARLTGDMGVLRTTGFLLRIGGGFDLAHVTFHLPEGWKAITPWAPDGDGFLLSREDQAAVDYLGVGPFQVNEIRVGASAIRVASAGDVENLGASQASDLVEYYISLVGAPFGEDGAARSVVLVPSSFMRGGAAGNRSIVQGSSPITLAHEVFHWWMSSDLVTSEARWFSEGFTNYYGIRAAGETGLISPEQATQCLSDLWAEMTHLESEGAQSLANASRAYSTDSWAQRLVYSKGTLFALALDREMTENQRGLDDVVSTILSRPRRSLTNERLRRFFGEVSGDQGLSWFDPFVTGANTLPDLDLPPGTGISGCARYLPGR